ncbi:MAG: hypothetical protein JWM28_1096, partial [Chitinophagaceae bacterium]|nr:hypothetical protein [Chitinophagaceae bacterium]
FLTVSVFHSNSQMITGIWKGKINKQKVELKIIQSGDSLTGTSYYYESANTYRRYSLKGYFDASTNSTVWWDDQLLEEKSKYTASTGKMPLLSRADFNCPGGAIMMLDGKSALKDDNTKPKGNLHLDKLDAATFMDEWNYVIDNYTTGANDPDIIDSIGAIAKHEPVKPQTETIVINEPQVAETTPLVIQKPVEQAVIQSAPPQEIQKPVTTRIEPSNAPTIEEKFLNRKKVFNKEIQLTGDSVELRFYDNAEIDGDSISLFLNDKLIFGHIRLTEKAYIVKLAVSDLNENNELIMVAENLGSIPPNTSYMLAIVGNNRYDAYLASTENSSAMIRFVKGKSSSQ